MATKEKLKTDEFDFDEDLNFDDLGFGDDSGFEVKDDRTPVIKVLDGVAEGAKDTLTDPGFIRKTVLESLPREYGETYAKLDEAGTGVVRLYNDAVKEVKPTVNRVIKQVDKLIPQESKRTRAFLEKIKEFVGEDYEYKQLSKEQQEEQSIQNSLGAIFQTQSEEEARQRNEDRAETLIQTQVEKDRFEHESGLLASIDNNLAKLTQYNEKINQAYQKKTLELQFRGYFLQQDMLATTKKYFEVFEKQNEAITKNTALPEFVKITKAESFKEHMREKFNTSVTAGLFGDNDFVKKGFERISNALKSKLQEFKSGLEDGVSMASEAKGAFSSEEEGGMGVDKYEFGGKMAGSQGVGYLGSKLGKYLRDKIESSDGKFAEWIKKTGFKGATAAGNVPGFLANLRNSDTLQDNWEDGGIKSALKEGTKWLLDQFTESGPDMSLAEAPGMNKLGAPAVFDNKVHRSITEIIPGFLSRILQELQITRTGNPAVPLTKFDYDGGGFTTTKKLAEKIKAKLKDDAKSTGYEGKLQETTRRFMADSKFDGKTQEAVQAFLKKKSFSGGAFDPKEMLGEDFLNTIPSSKRKAFKKFVEETYGQDTAKSAKNEFVFSNDMVNLRKSIADLRGSVQTYENAGYGDILRELGVVGNKRSNNVINSEAYQNLLLSDKDERKLEAKKAYQRAAKGEEDQVKPKSWELESDAVDVALKPDESGKYTPGGSFKIEEVSLEPITKRLDTIIENMKESPKEGTALSDIKAKKGISKFDPRQALENIKNTKIFNWMYKKGKGDEQAHVGPMAQDVNAAMGEEAAPGGTSIDLVSLNGNNMAAIEALRQEQEVIKEKVTKTPLPKDPQKPMGLLESIKQDTSTIADLLANKGIVIGSFPSIEFNTDGVEKLAKAFSDSMADYKEKSFEFFESMQKKLSEVSGFGMSMPNMPTFKSVKESKAAKTALSYFDKIKEKGKVVGSSMWEGTKSLFNFGKEKAKDAGGFLKRQYEDKKEPAKEAIGKVFKASFDIAGNVLKGANRIVTETLPAGVRQVKDLLKTVRDKALDILDQPTDIYVLGNPNPVMLANLMKFGHYFDQATGKPIVKPSQIVGPVVDKQGNYVLTAADLATGIVDKDGNKIETPVKKLIGIGVRAVANGISVANNAVRNVLSIGKGGGEKLLDGFRGMVKKLLPTDVIGFGFDKSHKVLLDIREILNNRLPGEPMQFSDAKPVTTTPATTNTPKEISDVVAKTTGQLSLFPEELVQEQTPIVENGEIKKPNTPASEVGAKVIQAKTKVRSLFEKAKNKATAAAKKVKRRLDLQDDGKEGIPTSFVDKLLNKAKVLKQKSVEFLKPVNETQTPNNDLQQDLFAGQTDQATQHSAPSPKTTLSVFKDKITNKLESVKQKSEPLLKRTRDAVAGLKKPETSLTASGNLQQESLSSAANIKQNIVSFFNSLKPKDEKENLDQLSLFENDSIAKVNNPVDKLKEQVIKTKDSLVQKFKDVKDTVNTKVNEKQQYNIPQAISNTVNLVKEQLKKVSNKEADSTDSVPNTKWSAQPLTEKLKSPKKTLSGFANTVSNWLGKEVEPKENKDQTDDLEVKVSEPKANVKNTDVEKKSVFESVAEFTVSGKGKLAELISDKLAGSLKEKVLSKLFGNKKQTDSSTLDANEDKKEKVVQTEKPEPIYKGGNVLDSVQNLAMGGLQKFKDSKIGSFVSERNSAGKADVKEKLLGLFDKLKDSGKKAKEFVTRTPQDRQQVVPQKETPSQAPEMPTSGIMTRGKGLLGGLLGKATGAIGGVAGMLGGLLPGGGNKTESPAKDTSAESEKEKPGALDEIKDLLSGLLKRREGPELEGGKKFNDADGDGDRDGNAQEQFDRIEQIKKDRDAKTDKTVASLDPRYKSSENIIDTIINKAKGLAGMVTGAAGGGSLLGTAADVLGNLPGRGGNGGVQLPQGTVPGQSGPGTAGPGTTVPKKPGRFGSILKGGAKLGLGAGAAYGLFHLAEKAREGGNETLSDALSMGGNVAGAYSAFQGLSGLASLASGAGGVTGALGTAASGALGGIGTLASGAMSVGGSLLGGAGSALLGAVSAPWIAIPGAVALTGYLGYKGYKYLTRNKATPVEAFRMAQYGLSSASSDKYSNVYGLEEYLNEKAIGYKNDQAYLIEKNIKPEEVLKILDVDVNNKQQMDNALRWFMVRFKPIYLSHLTALKAVSPKTRLQDVNDVPQEQLSKYLSAVEYPNGPYNDLTSPFNDVPKLTAGPAEVSKVFVEAKTKLEKENPGTKNQEGSGKTITGLAPAASAGLGIAAATQLPANVTKEPASENYKKESPKTTAPESVAPSTTTPQQVDTGKGWISSIKDTVSSGLTSVIPGVGLLGLGLSLKDKVAGYIPESVSTGAKDIFSGLKEGVLAGVPAVGAVGSMVPETIKTASKDIYSGFREGVGSAFSPKSAPITSMAELGQKAQPSTGVDYLGTGMQAQKPAVFPVDKSAPVSATESTDVGLAAYNKDPIMDPVQAGISNYGDGLGMAAGGIGAAVAAKSLFGGKKEFTPAEAVGKAATETPKVPPIPKPAVPAKPSLLSRIGGAVKSRGLKLGLAGAAGYGLFHLAEKARESGNETLSDALSMGGNVAGAYGAFQGLSGLASVMAGSGGITGALGTLGTAASGAVGALGSGAATVGSSLLGGGASVLGAVAMNPLFYVPAAAGLLAYGGYKAYKAYKRVKPTPITKLRLSQYGFTEKASDHYSPVLKLEEYLNEKAIGYNQGQAYLIEKNIKPEEIFNILGVPPKDAEGRSKALQWFVTRFKPVYLNHLSTLYSVAPKARLEDIDGLDDSVKQRYLPAVQMPDGPYDQLVSPIPGMEYLPAGPDAVQKAYEEATSSTGKKKQDKSVKDVLAFKESKLGTPANKDASVLPEAKSAEEKSVVHDVVKKTATVLGIESVYEGFKKLFTKPVIPFANAVTVDDKSPLTGLESVRFKLYGAINPTTVHVSAFRSFEKAMYPLLQMDSSLTVKVNAEAVQVLENYGKLFGVAINSKEAKVWLDWYFKRFLPVFTSFVGETYKLTFNSKFETNEKKLKPSEHYEVALKLTGLGNVWVCASNPFPGEVANTNPSSVDGNMTYMKSVASQKPAPELTLGSQTKLEPAKPLPQTAGANEQKAGKPADPTTSYSKPRPAESSEPADDGNYPLPPKKQSVSALGVPASQSYSAPDSEGEEKAKGEVNKPPKAKSAGPAGESSAPVSAPSSIPNAGGPLKTGVGGSKYLKKANAGVDLNGLNPMLSKHLLGMAQEYGEKTGQSIVVNSAYRSYEKQAALHRADPDKAAKPGKSLHEFGLAMDINEQIASKLESLGLMKKYGFTRPVGKEGWHIEPAGIQANLNKARQDKQFADQAIAASPGRGGGGAWDQPGVRKYGRNTRLALATFNAGSAQPVDLPETKTAQNSGSLPPPSQSTPASKDSPGGSASAAASKLSTGSSTLALGGGVKASQVNTVPGAVPGTVRSASPSGTNSADSSKPSQTLEPRSKPLPGSIPGTVAGKNSQTSAEEPEDAGTYNKPSKTRVVKGKEGVKDIIADAAKKAGVQPDYMQTIAAIESTMNPQARSPSGKAVGLYQFFPETWNEITQKAGKKYGITSDTPRTDPYASTIMAAEYAKAGEKQIKKYKSDPSAADFYLSHFLGPYGGPEMVKANPDVPASQIAPGPAKSAGNSSMFFKDKARTQPFTVAEFYNNVVNKLKTRAQQFGIKFTGDFYNQDKIKGAENSNTSGSREEAEYANAGQSKGVMRGGKSVEGSVPGTVRDSSKLVAESKQVGNQTTAGKPLQSAKAEDSYTTRDGSTITIKELPPLPDEQRTFKPTKSVLGETKPESNKESIYALNNYSLGNNKAADLPPGHFDKTAQPTTPLSTAPDKKDNTYVPRNKSTVSIAEVPVTSALTPSTPVSLTGGASAANSAVIGGQLKTDTRETFPRANLASGVDTTSVILNESLSVQKQMLDVLKNILTKSNTAPAPTAAQAPTLTSTNTVNNPATSRPAGELADEPRPIDPPRGGRFNPPTEALPKPAVSLKRMIA